MRIREIFATDLAASDRPVRVACGEGMVEVTLEPAVVEGLETCIEALLFPNELAPETLEPLARGSRFEAGMILRVGGQHDVRLRRGLDPDSVRLQVRGSDGKFQTRSTGAENVQRALEETLKRPPHTTFRPLHLGRLEAPTPRLPEPDQELAQWLETTTQGMERANLFGESESDVELAADDEPSATPDPLGLFDAAPLPSRSPAEIDRMRAEYVKAHKAESLDDAIARLRIRLRDSEAPQETPEIDSKLEEVRKQIRSVAKIEVTDDDIALLRHKDRRVDDYQRRRDALQTRLAKRRRQIIRGRQLLRNPVFAGGAVLAAVCTLASILGGPWIRTIALGNVVCLAATLFGLLQFLRARDDTRGDRQRILALEEALADLEEERRAFDRELALVRRKHQVGSAAELEEMRFKLEALEARERAILAEHEEQRGYVPPAVLAERERLQARLDGLLKEREQLGECPLASFQIAQELARLGVAAPSVDEIELGSTPTTGAPRVVSDEPVPQLVELATELGLFDRGTLESDTVTLWGRLLSALMNRALPAPRLSETGAIAIEPTASSPTAGLSSQQRTLTIESLRLALLWRAVGRVDPSPWPLVVRFNPYQGLDRSDTDRLRALYRRLSNHFQILIINAESAAETQV